MNTLTQERYYSEAPVTDRVHYSDAERAEHLGGLENTFGFTPGQRTAAVREIASIGMPVGNISSLHRRPNQTGREENALGSWGISSEEYGQYSLFERLDGEHPEVRLGTVAHELWHANSPYVEQNAGLYGSEQERARTEAFVTAVAEQTNLTGKYLNGYHAHLAKQLADDEIEEWRFREETGAIMAQLRVENLAKLRQVQESQHRQLERLKGQGKRVPAAVDIVTRPGRAPTGIDRALIALMPQVHSITELDARALRLKREFYRPEYSAVAVELYHAEIIGLFAGLIEQELTVLLKPKKRPPAGFMARLVLAA